MKLESEMMRGAGPTAVMHLLANNEMYGYELVEALVAKSKGIFEIGQSTLYPMLYNLEAKGMLTSNEKSGPNGRMRRYYKLTAKGRKKLDQDRAQWSALVEGMGALGVTRKKQTYPVEGYGLAIKGGLA